MIQEQQIPRDIQSNFLSTIESSSISKLIIPPLQRIIFKINERNELIKQKQFSTLYKRCVQISSQIYKQEGFLGFWKSSLKKLQNQIPNLVFKYTYRDLFKKQFNTDIEEDGIGTCLACNITSGGLAGMFSYWVTNSYEKISTNLQALSANVEKQQRQNGVKDSEVLQNDNISIKYGKRSVGNFIYSGMQYGLYDTLKHILPISQKKDDFRSKFLLGWEVTMITKIAYIPIDFLGKKIAASKDKDSKMNGPIENVRQMIEKEGLKYSYRNPSSIIFRSIASAGAISGYDYFLFGYSENYCENIQN